MKKPTSSRPTVVIAAGGTGGHVFPGIAVADALTAIADVRVVFFGTPRGLENRVVPERGYELELLEVQPLKGVTPARAATGVVVAAWQSARALLRLARLAPKGVLSIGGYAAGPVSLAAVALRVPLAVHEPNSIAGLANRILAPLAQETYLAFEGTRIRGKNARIIGVPLRKRFEPSVYKAKDTARVLVLGGSQGALALNDRLPEAFAKVKKAFPKLEVVHQSGRDKESAVRAAYAREGLPEARVVPFFEDVAAELAAADLVVARAGAVTVAEIAAVGRAAVLVPFPFAADDHQAKNAEALAKAGGALALRQEAADATRLAREIEDLLKDDARRVAMASAARAHGRADAARVMAEAFATLAKLPRRPPVAASKNGRGTNGVHATEVN
jgi:UDP-N-acetylglucosamine--N-acetylmuramyl-(pentapeptide) pyrophosphoryl-undecaprenol N-acetylglucosamine transferase